MCDQLSSYRVFRSNQHVFHGYRAIVKIVNTPRLAVGLVIFMTSNHDEYVGHLEYLKAGLVPRVTDSDVTFFLQQEQEPEESEESEHEEEPEDEPEGRGVFATRGDYANTHNDEQFDQLFGL